MLSKIIAHYGISTFFTNVETELDGSQSTKVGKLQESQLRNGGVIYGISVYADTVTPENDPLITSAQAANVYLDLVWGRDHFYSPVRLDDFIFTPVGVPTLPADKYLNVNIPGGFDLDKSNYLNPTLIDDVTIILNFLYITNEAYNWLVAKGAIMPISKAHDPAKK